MAVTETTLVSPVISVGLGLAVGYGLYNVITVKGDAAKAIDYGRKWLAWMVFIGTMSTLPRFFRLFDVDSFVRWVFGIIFFGSVAFVLGWVYGKLFGIKSQTGQDGPVNMDSKDYKVNQANLAPESIQKRLETLSSLFESGSITQQEYEMKRKDILNTV
jgi:hypothetical protein